MEELKKRGPGQSNRLNSGNCLASAQPLKGQRRPRSFSSPPWQWECYPRKEQTLNSRVFWNLWELQASLRQRGKTTSGGHPYGAGNIWIPPTMSLVPLCLWAKRAAHRKGTFLGYCLRRTTAALAPAQFPGATRHVSSSPRTTGSGALGRWGADSPTTPCLHRLQ